MHQRVEHRQAVVLSRIRHPHRSPRDGLLFFGLGRIDHRTRALTVSLRDSDDHKLFEVELPAAET